MKFVRDTHGTYRRTADIVRATPVYSTAARAYAETYRCETETGDHFSVERAEFDRACHVAITVPAYPGFSIWPYNVHDDNAKPEIWQSGNVIAWAIGGDGGTAPVPITDEGGLVTNDAYLVQTPGGTFYEPYVAGFDTKGAALAYVAKEQLSARQQRQRDKGDIPGHVRDKSPNHAGGTKGTKP